MNSTVNATAPANGSPGTTTAQPAPEKIVEDIGKLNQLLERFFAVDFKKNKPNPYDLQRELQNQICSLGSWVVPHLFEKISALELPHDTWEDKPPETYKKENQANELASFISQICKKDPSAYDIVITNLESHPQMQVQKWSAIILGWSENEKFAPQLIKALENQDLWFKLRVIHALQEIKSMDAIEPLFKLLKESTVVLQDQPYDNEDYSSGKKQIITTYGPRTFASFEVGDAKDQHSDEDKHTQAVMVESIVVGIRFALDKNSEAEVPKEIPASIKADFEQTVMDLLDNHLHGYLNDTATFNAAFILGYIGSEKAIDRMFEMADREHYPAGMTHNMHESIGQVGNARWKELLKTMSFDEAVTQRNKAVEMLMDKVEKSKGYNYYHNYVLKALGIAGDPRAETCLIDAVDDMLGKTETARIMCGSALEACDDAIEALGKLGLKSSIPVLAKHLKGKKKSATMVSDIRADCAIAIAQIGGDEAKAALLEALPLLKAPEPKPSKGPKGKSGSGDVESEPEEKKDPNSYARYHVIKGLVTMEAFSELENMLTNGDVSIRKTIAKALESYEGKADIVPLLIQVLNDNSDEVVSPALERFTKKPDPRAVQPLIGVMKRAAADNLKIGFIVRGTPTIGFKITNYYQYLIPALGAQFEQAIGPLCEVLSDLRDTTAAARLTAAWLLLHVDPKSNNGEKVFNAALKAIKEDTHRSVQAFGLLLVTQFHPNTPEVINEAIRLIPASTDCFDLKIALHLFFVNQEKESVWGPLTHLFDSKTIDYDSAMTVLKILHNIDSAEALNFVTWLKDNQMGQFTAKLAADYARLVLIPEKLATPNEWTDGDAALSGDAAGTETTNAAEAGTTETTETDAPDAQAPPAETKAP